VKIKKCNNFWMCWWIESELLQNKRTNGLHNFYSSCAIFKYPLYILKRFQILRHSRQPARLTALFGEASQWTAFWAGWIHSTALHPASRNFILSRDKLRHTEFGLVLVTTNIYDRLSELHTTRVRVTLRRAVYRETVLLEPSPMRLTTIDFF
jgi:hypothetical protein